MILTTKNETHSYVLGARSDGTFYVLKTNLKTGREDMFEFESVYNARDYIALDSLPNIHIKLPVR